MADTSYLLVEKDGGVILGRYAGLAALGHAIIRLEDAAIGVDPEEIVSDSAAAQYAIDSGDEIVIRMRHREYRIRILTEAEWAADPQRWERGTAAAARSEWRRTWRAARMIRDIGPHERMLRATTLGRIATHQLEARERAWNNQPRGVAGYFLLLRRCGSRKRIPPRSEWPRRGLWSSHRRPDPRRLPDYVDRLDDTSRTRKG